MVDTRGIHNLLKVLSNSLILRNDRLTMVRCIFENMSRCRLRAIHRDDRHLVVQKLRSETLLRSFFEQFTWVACTQHLIGTRVSIDGDTLCRQRCAYLAHIRQHINMQHHAIQGITDTHTSRLSIHHNRCRLGNICPLIHICVADSSTRLNHWDGCIFAHVVD